MSSPDANMNRSAYLAEVGKFKNLMRDCNADDSDGIITLEEGIRCMRNFVRYFNEPFTWTIPNKSNPNISSISP